MAALQEPGCAQDNTMVTVLCRYRQTGSGTSPTPHPPSSRAARAFASFLLPTGSVTASLILSKINQDPQARKPASAPKTPSVPPLHRSHHLKNGRTTPHWSPTFPNNESPVSE
jgi:hypothetical protein